MSHEHEVPRQLLSLVLYRLQVAPWTCVKCPRAALREGVALRRLPGRTGAGQSLSSLAACPQALVLKKSSCATVERWECRLLVHERDSQSVHSTADCTHSLTRCPHWETSIPFEMIC